ncbi:putative mitochondrial protein, conserved [Entomortierella chlamydospora]|uniref:Succinate dehydrogenase assembly factor 4, mitochondrial n=1 Tax=Entomortierella chlamydospora TaxID=101097 RepID=A0A9P6MLT9_9FUNG|nr:putative mitochondrial protein, conserved [Entomortierella chlamydospora]KAG0007434.1 putative mitochondrial protein, conserved [Entomortierella chlamydospora]
MSSSFATFALRSSANPVLLRTPRTSTLSSPATGALTALVLQRSYSSTGIRPRAPAPIPLGSAKDQAEFEQLVKEAESAPLTSHPDARTPVPEEFEGDTNPITGEVGGPKREPVRFGDWSFKGRVTDF